LAANRDPQVDGDLNVPIGVVYGVGTFEIHLTKDEQEAVLAALRAAEARRRPIGFASKWPKGAPNGS
jgi:hypothetical protein